MRVRIDCPSRRGDHYIRVSKVYLTHFVICVVGVYKQGGPTYMILGAVGLNPRWEFWAVFTLVVVDGLQHRQSHPIMGRFHNLYSKTSNSKTTASANHVMSQSFVLFLVLVRVRNFKLPNDGCNCEPLYVKPPRWTHAESRHYWFC